MSVLVLGTESLPSQWESPESSFSKCQWHRVKSRIASTPYNLRARTRSTVSGETNKPTFDIHDCVDTPWRGCGMWRAEYIGSGHIWVSEAHWSSVAGRPQQAKAKTGFLWRLFTDNAYFGFNDHARSGWVLPGNAMPNKNFVAPTKVAWKVKRD